MFHWIDWLFLSLVLPQLNLYFTGRARCPCCLSYRKMNFVCVWACFVWCFIRSAVCFCYNCFALFSHTDICAQVTLRLSLGKLTCAHRLFPTEPAEHASKDKPSALISDYVTVKRTGRGRRRFVSTHSFFFSTAIGYSLCQVTVCLSDRV